MIIVSLEANLTAIESDEFLLKRSPF
jgi:hypothetical protein